MKKTLTISISGIVFHIEEDAYDRLHRYLEAISLHFKGFEGRQEVIADIEARITEILQSKITSVKEVINQADVDAVIGIMGQPSDFGPEEESVKTDSAQTDTMTQKRLYRDSERKMLGGICSGLGAYFRMDPLWWRIIFLVSIAFSGFGLLVYLILWIIVPEARTTAEKLEMRGEPVTISSIEKNFRDEMHDLNERFRELASRARTTYRKEKDQFTARHGENIRNGLSGTGNLLLRIIIIFIGVILLLLGLSLSVLYLSILLKFPVIAVMDQAGLQAFPLYSIIDRIFASDADIRTFVTGMMVLAGVPLIMMLWGGIRLILNLPRVRFLPGIAGLIWICALIITLVFGFKVAGSFRYPGEFTRESTLDFTSRDTVHIAAIKSLPDDDRWERNGFFYFPEVRMVVSNDREVIRGVPLIKIKPGQDSTSQIRIITSSKGTFRNEAEENAEKVNYTWQLVNDTLWLSDSFILPENEKWRKQDVRVEILLPKGTVITIDRHLHPFLGYHKNISYRDRKEKHYLVTEEGLVSSER